MKEFPLLVSRSVATTTFGRLQVSCQKLVVVDVVTQFCSIKCVCFCFCENKSRRDKNDVHVDLRGEPCVCVAKKHKLATSPACWV